MASETSPPSVNPPDDLALPCKLDLAFCEGIAPQLGERRGGPLCFCAEKVGFVGVPGLQLLLSAQKQWQADGQEYLLRNVSDAMREGFALLGYSSFPFKEAPTA